MADVDVAGNLELVVADRSGMVHVFELPGDADGARLPWPEYGHDARSTFNATTVRDLSDHLRPGSENTLAAAARPVWLTIGPNPQRAVSWAAFEVPQSGPVKLEIFDVQGRRIRGLLEQELERGKYRLAWDGRTDRGTNAGKGVFLFRLTLNGGSLTRKVSVVQ